MQAKGNFNNTCTEQYNVYGGMDGNFLYLHCYFSNTGRFWTKVNQMT